MDLWETLVQIWSYVFIKNLIYTKFSYKFVTNSVGKTKVFEEMWKRGNERGGERKCYEEREEDYVIEVLIGPNFMYLLKHVRNNKIYFHYLGEWKKFMLKGFDWWNVMRFDIGKLNEK